MRKNWIDNVRTLCILWLFPFHSAMIFNGFGEEWYILSTPSVAASILNFSTFPWWMSGLFVLAGVSTVYSLKTRSARAYAKERIMKLFLPFLSGVVLIIPLQGYYAVAFRTGQFDNYLHYLKSFLEVTDFGGYDGHLSPGNLWFILYLFVISMISLPLLMWYQRREKKIDGSKIVGWKLLLLGVIPTLIEPIGDIGGKSMTEYLGWFLIGYFVLSDDTVQEWIRKYWYVWTSIFVLLLVLRSGFYIYSLVIEQYWEEGIAGTPITRERIWTVGEVVFRWIGILNMFGLGMKYLDFSNSKMKYLARANFPIYIFHQSVLVILAYYICNYISSAGVQYILILTGSFIGTMIIYELARKSRVLRFLFAIKK